VVGSCFAGKHTLPEDEMEALDVQDLLEYARAAVAVIRGLKITGSRMRYGQLAKAIGLISDDASWQPWHCQQITAILCIAAAAERQANQSAAAEPLEFERIINESGEPGIGVLKNSRIISA
jgi:hypothetical protein